MAERCDISLLEPCDSIADDCKILGATDVAMVKE